MPTRTAQIHTYLYLDYQDAHAKRSTANGATQSLGLPEFIRKRDELVTLYNQGVTDSVAVQRLEAELLLCD